MNLAIIGAGMMGKWFADLGRERGWTVRISDIETEKAQKVSEELGIEYSKNNESVVEDADIVLIAVPVKETPRVIREIADYLPDNCLLVDIASVKEDVVETMKEIDVNSELVSLHPLFGPGAESLEGENIIFVPVVAGSIFDGFREVLSGLGARVLEMDARKHDELMAVIQSLTHFTLLTYLSAFDSMKGSDEAVEFSTPVFRKLLNLAKAFLHEDPGVCGDIQTVNRYAPMARSSIIESCRSLDVALKAENTGVIKEVFEEALERFDSEEIEEAYKMLYEKDG